MVLKRLLLLVLALCFSSNVSAYNYKIKEGDTLKELSKRFNTTVGELIELNGLKGGQIYVGGVISIPDQAPGSDPALIKKSSSIEYKQGETRTHSYVVDEFGVKVNYFTSVNNRRTEQFQIGPALYIHHLTTPIYNVEDSKSNVTIPDGIDNLKPSQPPESESLPPLRYGVKKGDTLSKISGSFGVTVQDLMQTNGLSHSRLKPGMILLIPSTGTDGIVRNATPEKPSIKYIVKDGDTIEQLSKTFDIPIDSIKSANDLMDKGVTAGEILILPDSKYEKDPLLQASIVTGITNHRDAELRGKLTSRSLDDKVTHRKEVDGTENDLNSLTRRVINTALIFLGVPYKFGGNSPSTGLDCSAYVRKVFGILNIELPRTARDIYHVGKYVKKSQLATGDLVFFRTYARYPSHVGIYLGGNKFIHASSRSKMVTIDDLDFNYYKKRYIGAKRIESDGLFYDQISENQTAFEVN